MPMEGCLLGCYHASGWGSRMISCKSHTIQIHVLWFSTQDPCSGIIPHSFGPQHSGNSVIPLTAWLFKSVHLKPPGKMSHSKRPSAFAIPTPGNFHHWLVDSQSSRDAECGANQTGSNNFDFHHQSNPHPSVNYSSDPSILPLSIQCQASFHALWQAFQWLWMVEID